MLVILFQHIMVTIVRLFALVLRTIEIITNKKLISKFKDIGHILLTIISFSFIFLWGYQYTHGIGENIIQGYFDRIINYSYIPLHSNDNKPILVHSISNPIPTAKSYLVIDKNTDAILLEKDADRKYPPASISKLMTGLISLDIYDYDEVIQIPEICTTIDSTKAYLPKTAFFSVKDLIFSMLIGSAGDSACALSMGKVSYDTFVNLMNRKASLIGMKNTHFSNPIGLDDNERGNYSTASDLYLLTKEAMSKSLIKEAVGTQYFLLSSQDNSFINNIYTTNRLLNEIPNTLGVKTGTTESAGEVLVYNYADGNKDLIIIVMGSTNRFEDTKSLLKWTLDSYNWNN